MMLNCSRRAGAIEIEVTPEMVEAGVMALVDSSGPDIVSTDTVIRVLRSIFQASQENHVVLKQ